MIVPPTSADLHLVGGPALVSRGRAAGYDAMSDTRRASWLAAEQDRILREAREASGQVAKIDTPSPDRPTGSA